MNINEFIHVVRYARKRTGVLLADDAFKSVIGAFDQAGFTIVDAVDQFDGKIFLTGDQLLICE